MRVFNIDLSPRMAKRIVKLATIFPELIIDDAIRDLAEHFTVPIIDRLSTAQQKVVDDLFLYDFRTAIQISPVLYLSQKYGKEVFTAIIAAMEAAHFTDLVVQRRIFDQFTHLFRSEVLTIHVLGNNCDMLESALRNDKTVLLCDMLNKSYKTLIMDMQRSIIIDSAPDHAKLFPAADVSMRDLKQNSPRGGEIMNICYFTRAD